MLRRIGPVLVCLLAACGDGKTKPPAPPPAKAPMVDLGRDPQPTDLESAPAVVTPPRGRWRVQREAGIPGQSLLDTPAHDFQGLAQPCLDLSPVQEPGLKFGAQSDFCQRDAVFVGI